MITYAMMATMVAALVVGWGNPVSSAIEFNWIFFSLSLLLVTSPFSTNKKFWRNPWMYTGIWPASRCSIEPIKSTLSYSQIHTHWQVPLNRWLGRIWFDLCCWTMGDVVLCRAPTAVDRTKWNETRQKDRNREIEMAICVSREYDLSNGVAAATALIPTVQLVVEHDKQVFRVVDHSCCLRLLPSPIMGLLIHRNSSSLTDMSVNDAIANLQLKQSSTQTSLSMTICGPVRQHLIPRSWHIWVRWSRENNLTASISIRTGIDCHLLAATVHCSHRVNRLAYLWNGLNGARSAKNYTPTVRGTAFARSAPVARYLLDSSRPRWMSRAKESEIVAVSASCENGVANILTTPRRRPTYTNTRPGKSPELIDKCNNSRENFLVRNRTYLPNEFQILFSPWIACCLRLTCEKSCVCLFGTNSMDMTVAMEPKVGNTRTHKPTFVRIVKSYLIQFSRSSPLAYRIFAYHYCS